MSRRFSKKYRVCIVLGAVVLAVLVLFSGHWMYAETRPSYQLNAGQRITISGRLVSTENGIAQFNAIQPRGYKPVYISYAPSQAFTVGCSVTINENSYRSGDKVEIRGDVTETDKTKDTMLYISVCQDGTYLRLSQ